MVGRVMALDLAKEHTVTSIDINEDNLMLLEGLNPAIKKIAANLKADVALFAADRRRLAAVGDSLPAPDTGRERSGWLRRWGGPPAGAIHLPDGRWLVARARHDRHRPLFGLFFMLITWLFFVQTAPFAPHLANIRLQPIGVANDNHTLH